MKKNNNNQKGINLISKEIMKEAHKLTRELKSKYKDIDYQTQLGLYISYLLEEEKNNREIDFTAWFEDYEANQKYYGYILYNNNILQKNGKLTLNIENDKNVSSYYNISYSDIEDIKQSIIVKMLEKFERDGTITYKYRGTTYGLIALNVLKSYSRHLTRFKAYNQDNYSNVGFNDEGQATITVEDDKTSIFKLDIQKVLSDRQYEIVSLLEQGYNIIETAEQIGISRQAIHDNINKIKNILKENDLAIGY